MDAGDAACGGRSKLRAAWRPGRSRRRALVGLGPRCMLPFSPARSTRRPCSAAPRRRIVVEIGFGMGDATAAWWPRTRPTATCSASRSTRPASARCCGGSSEMGLENVRIVRHEIATNRRAAADMIVCRHRSPPSARVGSPTRGRRSATTSGGSSSRMQFRRARRVAPGAPAATVHCATDWVPYAEADARGVGRARAGEPQRGRRLRRAAGMAAADEVRGARAGARPRGPRPALRAQRLESRHCPSAIGASGCRA